MLRFLTDSESRIEKLLNTLQKTKDFTASEAFASLDKASKGYIEKRDLKIFLENQYFYPSEKDLDGLMQFFDRNAFERIKFRDFDRELRPKLSDFNNDDHNIPIDNV